MTDRAAIAAQIGRCQKRRPAQVHQINVACSGGTGGIGHGGFRLADNG